MHTSIKQITSGCLVFFKNNFMRDIGDRFLSRLLVFYLVFKCCDLFFVRKSIFLFYILKHKGEQKSGLYQKIRFIQISFAQILEFT